MDFTLVASMGSRASTVRNAACLALWGACMVGCNDPDPAVGDASSDSTAAQDSSGSGGAMTQGTTADTSTGTPAESSGTGTSAADSTGTPTPLVANDDQFFAVQDQAFVASATAGVLANDEGAPLMIVDSDTASLAGGTVAIDADGSLAYVAPAGFWGPDEFGYVVGDGVDEAAARVRVFVAPRAIDLGLVAGGLGGFTITGEVLDDRACSVVAGGGDMDGDGLADLAIGAPFAGPTGGLSGAAYVVFGKADTEPVSLADISAAAGGGFAMLGENGDDLAGNAVALGDVDGDGAADVVVGATAALSPEGNGRAYVIYARADASAISLQDFMLAGAGGYTINAAAGGDGAGAALAVIGDLDGDGRGDVAIGAPFADREVGTPNSGRSYVSFGRADSVPVLLSDVAADDGGFMLLGDVADDRSGQALAAAGDVNGDGVPDFIVAAAGSDANGSAAGRAYVVFGRADMTTLDLRDELGGTDGFVIDGVAGSVLGVSVAGAGDVDGDGLADVVVGAQGSGDGGAAIVVFGKADTAAVDAGDILAGGGGGFAFVGDVDDDAGHAVALAGDVNGDGRSDVLVGAPARFGGSRIGRAYLVYGKADADPVTAADLLAGSDAGFVLTGEQVGDLAGDAVAAPGDVDGDGLDDLVIGATQSNNQHHVGPGRCYVVFGVRTAAR